MSEPGDRYESYDITDDDAKYGSYDVDDPDE